MTMYKITAWIEGRGRVQHMVKADDSAAAGDKVRAAYPGAVFRDIEAVRVKR